MCYMFGHGLEAVDYEALGEQQFSSTEICVKHF